MGAWGVDPFDNDDAADWAAEFEGLDRGAGLRVLEAALAGANGTGYIEAGEGSLAVAAAQVVAWLLVPPEAVPSPYSAAAVAWTLRNGGSPSRAMIDAARRALGRVRSEESELAELWGETADDRWQLDLQRIDAVLGDRPP
jgi:hypothetical protein